MKITDAGSTLVLSEVTDAERKHVLAKIREPATKALATMNRREVARVFGVHPGSLKRWEKSGKLHPIKITPRCLRYDKSEIESLFGGELA